MFKVRSIKRYVFIRVTLLALFMSISLSYFGTQLFLKGINGTRASHMILAANSMAENEIGSKDIAGFIVSSGWEYVPNHIKHIFNKKPDKPLNVQLHYENWWYFAPPEKIYSLVLVINQFGDPIYISYYKDFSKHLSSLFIIFQLNDPMVQMALGGFVLVAFFIIVLFFTFRFLTQPAASFYQWVDQLDLETVKQPTPNFHYQELILLSQIIKKNMKHMGMALDREKEFLAFASHELRTPMTSLMSDAALLDKINSMPSSKEREVRERIDRSCLSMKHITETLLWLNRSHTETLACSEVDLEALTHQIISNLKYLIADKEVKLSITTLADKQKLPEAAALIVIGNLIRNAFQHTHYGCIDIIQAHSQVQVINPIQQFSNTQGAGFGLGLKLIQKIGNSFNWQVILIKTDKLYDLTIKFNAE